MEYDIDTIIKRLSEPEKLIDPAEINILQSYLNGHITDLEEEAWSRQLVASNKLAEMIKDTSDVTFQYESGETLQHTTKGMSVAKAEALWKVSNEWRLWQGVERTIKKLKRYRADLRDRFQILTNTKRY